MSTSHTRELAQRFLVFINTQDEKLASELISPDIRLQTPMRRDPYCGPAGYLELLRHIRSSFPDVQWELEEMVAEGDSAACHFTARGTHAGEFFGIPPTNKKVSWPAMNIYTFNNDKLVREYAQPDFLTLLQQLGMFA